MGASGRGSFLGELRVSRGKARRLGEQPGWAVGAFWGHLLSMGPEDITASGARAGAGVWAGNRAASPVPGSLGPPGSWALLSAPLYTWKHGPVASTQDWTASWGRAGLSPGPPEAAAPSSALGSVPAWIPAKLSGMPGAGAGSKRSLPDGGWTVPWRASARLAGGGAARTTSALRPGVSGPDGLAAPIHCESACNVPSAEKQIDARMLGAQESPRGEMF